MAKSIKLEKDSKLGLKTKKTGNNKTKDTTVELRSGATEFKLTKSASGIDTKAKSINAENGDSCSGNLDNNPNNSSVSNNKKKSKREHLEQQLLKEIKALGGDSTDLDLLKDVLSDSEIEDNNQNDRKIDEKALKLDLSSFMKKMDFESINVQSEDLDESDNDVPIEPVVEKATETAEAPKESESPKTSELIVNLGEQKWFEKFPPQKVLEEADSLMIIEKRRVAQKLWDQDCQTYKQKSKKESKVDHNFIQNILKSGTLSDKISALTMLVQDSPIHNYLVLKDELFSMVNKTKRRETLQAVESIKDLFVNTILPDRKLKYFMDQPLANAGDDHLVVWVFEDAIKKLYHQFVENLEEMLKDELDHVKTKALNSVFDLICSKPEQEGNLLALIINQMVKIVDRVIWKRRLHQKLRIC